MVEVLMALAVGIWCAFISLLIIIVALLYSLIASGNSITLLVKDKDKQDKDKGVK